MIVSDKFTNTENSPSKARARVELYNGSTLLNIYSDADYLQGFAIERIGEAGKFFGFGVSHKITVTLGDHEKKVNLAGADRLEMAYGIDTEFLYAYPYFTIAEAVRDEATKEITITAYDALATASDLTSADLELPEGERTIKTYAVACAQALGLPLSIEGGLLPAFELNNAQSANFEGTESIRDVLNDIAEATQTIYYINSNWALTFKRLDRDGAAVATITNDNSMNIIVGENKVLTGITHATELGDNVSAATGESGVVQYVRDNAFWDLRDDIADILSAALERVGGMTNGVFAADWFGNYLLEIGDKIEVTTEDGTICSYILNDVITYSGIVLEQSQWTYASNADEHANPSTLGEALKQTFARVDKANKRIELLVSETAENSAKISKIEMSTESISASVSGLENSVNAKLSDDNFSVKVKEVLESGEASIKTEMGYTFGADGLKVEKEGSEMSTRITEDGMSVSRNGGEVLTANNEGVNATNLHAKTYLIVGENSRFEDYNYNRTACFWIGGN